MKLRHTFTFCCFCLLAWSALTGCNASKSESALESSDEEATSQVAAAGDRSALSGSAAHSEDEMSKPEPPEPAPAPGTVYVTAEILSAAPEENEYRCTLRIISVEAYGMGTRPLQADAEITAFARKKIVESVNNPILPPDDDNKSAPATPVERNIVLKYQQMPNLAGLEARAWSILSIQ